MKKFVAFVAIILAFAVFSTGCFRKTAKGKNAKIDYTGTASVSFYPVCPKCDHVSPYMSVNVSDGEQLEGAYICEKCEHTYTIVIDRT